jgi:glycosyltransferase involved in cell wall biosynthesis
MRIIFIIDNLGAGGTQRRFVEHIKGVKIHTEIEFEVVIMSNLAHYKDLADLDIKIHYLVRKSKKDLSVFKKFYTICKNYKPAIVHSWESMTSVIAVPTCKLLNIKFVNGMIVDTPVKQSITNKYWFRGKLTFPFSTIVIGNSEAGILAYGAPAKKSICVYNGMALSRFQNLKDPVLMRKEIYGEDAEDVFIVGMVAAFHDRKDYKTLIRAAIILTPLYSNLRFVLVGNGENLSDVKSIVPDSLLHKIKFLGRRSDVESIINIFDIGVLLTNTKVHGEGISNSIIEYMALCKPVIATRGGGTNEAVIENKNGFLIDDSNENQLAEKIGLLINDRDLMYNLGKTGNDMVLEKFDLKIMTNNYINVYKKIMKKSEIKQS